MDTKKKKKQKRFTTILISFIIIIAGFAAVIFVFQSASAVFGFVRVNHCIQSSTSVSTCTISTTVTAGDTEIVIVGIRTGTSTVSTVQSAGSTYTKKVSFVNTVGIEIWATEPGKAASASIIYVNLTAASKFIAIAADYNAVASFGIPFSTSYPNSNPSVTRYVQQNTSQSIVIAGFSGTPDNAFSANIGNLRDSAVTTGNSASSRNGLALVDITATTQGSQVQPSVINADTVWAISTIEINKGPISLVYSALETSGSISGSNIGGRTNVIVTVQNIVPVCHISSITDTGGSTYYEFIDYTDSNNNHIEIWATNPDSSIASTTISISGVSGCNHGLSYDLEYVGVKDFGNTNTNYGTGSTSFITMTTQDTDNILIGAAMKDTNVIYTQQNGYKINNMQPAPNYYYGAIIQDHSPTATSVTASMTATGSPNWAMAMLELRNRQPFLTSSSCTADETPLTANKSFYVEGFVNYVRFICTADGFAYRTGVSIVATPTFTLPSPYTQLWSFQSSTGSSSCSGGTGAWQMSSGVSHTFPSGTTNWDYCAVIPNTATGSTTGFNVAWNT